MRHYKSGFVLCALVAVVLAGCNSGNENEQHYKNKIFVETSVFMQEMRIGEGEATLAHDITVGMAKPEADNITARLTVSSDLVNHFREAFYEPEAELLPEGHYDLSDAGIVIEAGKMASEPLHLEFTGLDGLDMDKVYVLPVSLADASIGVLSGAETVYFLFKEASLVNVVAELLGSSNGSPDQKDNMMWPGPDDWNDPAPVTDMSAFTLEALVNFHTFDNAEIATIMGIEDTFLVRVGDNGIPKNQLQVAWGVTIDGVAQRANLTDAALQLKPGQWYHVAVTFDQGAIAVYLDGKRIGEADSATGMNLTSVNFGVPHSDETDGKPRCFWISHSYADGRALNGMISETRIWNRALSTEEINAEDHFYRVDPASDDLVAYWRFNEGEGNVVKDHTAYGNDLYSAQPLRWQPVSLPIEE